MREVLSADQVSFYQDNGYLVLENQIPPEWMTRIRAEIARFEEEAARHVYITDHAVMQHLHGLANVVDGAVLETYLNNFVVLAGRSHHLPAFKHIVAGRLLYIHILTCLAGPNRCQCVPVVGCCNRNGINVRVIEDFPHIHGRSRRVSLEFSNPGNALGEEVLIDITNRLDPHVLISRHAGPTPQMPKPLTTHADDGKMEPFIGPNDICIAFCRKAHGTEAHARRAGRERFECFSSGLLHGVVGMMCNNA